MCIVIIFYPGCEGTNFETDFLSSRFPTWPKKSGQKLKYVKNKNSLSIWNKKHFFIFFKGLLLRLIKQTFLEGERPTLKHVVDKILK